MSTIVPPLYAGLVDDASLLPPSPTGLADAEAKYREHATAWYADLIGTLLVPASVVGAEPVPRVPAALVGDIPAGALPATVEKLRAAGMVIEHVEAAVARRGEDPQPGLSLLRTIAAGELGATGSARVWAEIPLSWGLIGALDTVAEARREGLPIAPKFRVGGLAAELFPTPVELAAVICACRDRELEFKLAAGLRHATRHTDPETGFTHHGFLNVLVATLLAVDGGEVAEVAEALAATHPVPLVEPARAHRDDPRPLFAGFGAASVVEPLTELIRLGLVNGGYEG
ncbi:hypothetical protein ACWT_7903 [Actinoplanes sp. SE50]|uniref:hypothetical protein n=1 Tax=unclassified Actinoplanes TaxID=2626549 RepID=UPI00023EDFC4|nr:MULTISPECIES: hypothetical protein [unclassified Actinoplanes]AEV88912.1 hypothetical protein ACPL_8034 [Actinoplanes sp. SE50/110]ATO87318.1 hypothetical protein ACWT_7903 [Actinoplanes sp. SE50]SLM04736.1 hypothetical protein ACSP50_8044 [Actinoplanes sp. SE50/110]